MNRVGNSQSYPRLPWPTTYITAMKILNNQVRRDWELESACAWVRKAKEADNGYEFNQACANLGNVLTTRYHFGERD
jgi:hypothetical protein